MWWHLTHAEVQNLMVEPRVSLLVAMYFFLWWHHNDISEGKMNMQLYDPLYQWSLNPTYNSLKISADGTRNLAMTDKVILQSNTAAGWHLQKSEESEDTIAKEQVLPSIEIGFMYHRFKGEICLNPMQLYKYLHHGWLVLQLATHALEHLEVFP